MDDVKKRLDRLEANEKLRELEAIKGRNIFVPHTITEEQANKIIELLEKIVEMLHE